MTLVEAMDALKEFLQEEVASQMKLQKEQTSPVEYVNPFVAKVTLPHKNFMPVDFQVPFILVGLSSGIDDMDENKATIRILCATYGGNVTDDIPDETGYEDLLNLIERIKLKLVETAVIKGAGTVNKPIQYGIYDTELTYPYWYGYLQFDMQLPFTEFPMWDF